MFKQENSHWLGVATVLLAGFCMAMHVGKVPPAVSLVAADLDMSLVVSGWLLSLFALLGATTGSFVGRVVDHLGQKRTLLFGLACAAVGSFLGAMVQAAPLLLICRALEGIGFVSVVVAAPALIFREAKPHDHRLAFGLWSTWMPVGGSLMMAVSPLLLAAYGWRANWQTAGGMTMTALFLVSFLVTPDDGRHRERPKVGLLEIVKLPAPWILAASFTFYSMAFQTVFAFLPSYLVSEQHLAPAPSAWLTAGAMLINVVGNLAAGHLAHRFARWQLIILAAVVMGLCGFGIFSADMPLPMRYALCLAFSAFGGLIPGLIFISVPFFAPGPAYVGAFGGMIVQGLSIGQLSGPPTLAFLVHESGSWAAAPLFILFVTSVSCLLALAFRRQERLKRP